MSPLWRYWMLGNGSFPWNEGKGMGPRAWTESDTKAQTPPSLPSQTPVECRGPLLACNRAIEANGMVSALNEIVDEG